MRSSAVLLVLVSAMLAVDAKPSNSLDQTMSFAKMIIVNGVWAGVSGEVGPRSFFDHLHRVSSGNNAKFLYKKSETRSFPERLTIRVSVIGPLHDAHSNSPPYFDKAYMETITFKAEWKNGEEVRPVGSLRKLTPYAMRTPLTERACLGGGCDLWIYELKLEEKDVPLSDDLILHTISPDNQELATFSVHL